MTTPISGTSTTGGVTATGVWAKTATGLVAVTRRIPGTAPAGPSTVTGTATLAVTAAVVARPPVSATVAVTATISVTPDQVSPLTAPTGTRFSTGVDLALLDGPTTAPVGAVTINPGTPLDAATNAQPAGTTFYLTAGKHTLGLDTEFNQIGAKAGNTYIGAPGAVVDGQFFHRYCFSGNTSGVKIRYLEICNFVAPADEFVVNHDTGPNWTIEYCNIHSNHAAAVGLGDNNVLRYSWVHHNKQYGFSGYNDVVNDALSNAVNNVTIDHCEIQENGDPLDEWLPDSTPTNFGRNGAGKFWDTNGMVVTNNWVHHSNFVGVWADTNNVNMLLQGNLIEDIWGEGFFYEISYNFLVQYNTFRRCCIGKGFATGDSFPRPAIYISESGSEPRLAGYNTTSEIRYNRFINNYDDIGLWENADRFGNSLANTSGKIWLPLGGAASFAVCNNPTPRTLTVTLTSGSPNFTVTAGTFEYWDEGQFVTGTGIPAGTKIRVGNQSNGFASGYIDSTHGVLTANATTSGSVTMTIAGGSINTSPGFYDCRWHTNNVKVHHNTFDHNRAEVLGTMSTSVTTGKHSLLSQSGTVPSWSPYQGDTIQQAITFNQNNTWSNNTYKGNYTQWQPFDTSVSKTFAQWQAAPYNQDAGSTLNTTPATGAGGGNYHLSGPPTAVTAVAGNASARVSFLPPIDVGGHHITGYTVTASPGGATGTAVGGPITVTGLTNGTAYTFTVTSRTRMGLSTASSASSAVTPSSGATLSSTVPPWHPRYPTARRRTSTTAEVSFVQPAATGGAAITGYTVTASPGGATATGTTGPITVSGLTTGQSYSFTVKATNSAGTGPPSPATDPVTLPGSTTTTSFTASTSTIPNPERGFFQYAPEAFASSGTFTQLDQTTMTSNRTTNNQSMVFKYYVLDSFRTTDTISAAFLTGMTTDFTRARNAGCKMILRFSYSNTDTSGTPSGPHNDAPALARVLTHISQLATTINANADVIDAVEAGFIGVWGEWYYTDLYGNQGTTTTTQWNSRISVLNALYDTLDSSIFLLVRYVGIKKRWLG